jgi:hypothetical protein
MSDAIDYEESGTQKNMSKVARTAQKCHNSRTDPFMIAATIATGGSDAVAAPEFELAY